MNGDDCNCCEGLTAQTPAVVNNRPGLSAISYRVGTQSQFKASMIAALSDITRPALHGLKTRDDNDFSIALLDAAATMADVLTFYQERIASESFLRTATERRSLLELGRLIGYELRPGVAASTFLAFTMDTTPGAPLTTMVDIGTKVQSVPGPNEKPQTFETIEKIETRVEWNALKPQLKQVFIPQFGDTHVYLKGTATNLKPGDALLFVGNECEQNATSERWDFRLVTSVVADFNAQRTRVEWSPGLGTTSPHLVQPSANPKVYALRQQAGVFGYNAPDWRMMADTVKASYLGLDNPGQLTAADKKEWPDFNIFSPVYPLQPAAQVIESLLIQPTARSVADAAIAAAHDAATKLGHKAAAAAARTALSAATVADDAAKTAAKAVDGIKSVATTTAESVIQQVKTAIDGLATVSTAVDQLVTNATSNIALPSVDDATGFVLNLSQDGFKADLSDSAKNAVEAALGQAKTTIGDVNVWQPIVDAAGAAAFAAGGPAAELANLVTDAGNFVNSAKAAVIEASASAAGAGVAVTIIGLIKEIADDPDATVEDVRAAAEQAANDAPNLAAAETAAVATAYPVLLPLLGLVPAARSAGAEIGDAVRQAVRAALIPKSQTLPSRAQRLKKTADTIDLDQAYPKILLGGWLILSLPDYQELYRIDRAVEASRAEFSLTGKTTRVTLNGENINLFANQVRYTTVFTQSELLEMDAAPITAPITGASIVLDPPPAIAVKGRWVMATGKNSLTNEEISEVVQVSQIDGALITLTPPLANNYARESFSLNANVAHATHGETVSEILGSGDASQTYQQFTLRQPPLTYISAATASGAASTLEVRINDVLWHETPTLYGRGPQEHVFISRTGDDGKTTIEFGDSLTGARLPTGQDNVRVIYRKGIGLEGLVKAGQLTSLLTRPLGIKSAINPEAATGAQDRESLADARTNAPLTVQTLDRTVSLQDYEDFSRAFAGVAKALATWTWDGQMRRVFITVAGPAGAEIQSDSSTYQNLLAALQQAGDPFVNLRVSSYRPAYFRLAANVKLDPDYETDLVLSAVEQALRAEFSFGNRAFGQPVMLSEVIAVMQAVPGVVAVELNHLFRTDAGTVTLETRLLAALPETLANGDVAAAELLTLEAAPLDQLGVMS